jgi:hypothetical protein
VQQRIHSGRWFGCVVAAAESLPFRNESFDCVYCLSTLRHLADLERVLAEAGRVLRPGGLFVALQEPYRGILTTHQQRLQGSASFMLARGWESRMRADASSQALFKNAGLGSILYEVCRRVPSCLEALEAAGLDGWVLPTPVVLALEMSQQANLPKAADPAWLPAFTITYGLDLEPLEKALLRAGEDRRQDLLSQLLGHWIYVGNMEGILIGSKGRMSFDLPWKYPTYDPERNRQCELLLLACARRGFIPLYGFYPPENDGRGNYYWMQPQAGLLVATAHEVEITIAVPSRPWLTQPQRLEIRVEDEAFPRAVFAATPGKTVSLRLPLRGADLARPSLLLRLTAGHDFVPSDQGGNTDTRLLAYQLRDVTAGRVPGEWLEAFVLGGETDQAALALGHGGSPTHECEAAPASCSCQGA